MSIIYKNGTYYGGGGGGAEITIDNELSSTSENPVQNKVIKAELDNKQDADDLMTLEDIDDVVTPLPGIASKLPRYSTEEQIVGYWIDGKPIYQKVLLDVITVSGSSLNIYINNPISNIENIINVVGLIKVNNKLVPLPSGWDGSICYVNVDSTYLYFLRTNNSERDGTNISYIIQYTKTTD